MRSSAETEQLKELLDVAIFDTDAVNMPHPGVPCMPIMGAQLRFTRFLVKCLLFTTFWIVNRKAS